MNRLQIDIEFRYYHICSIKECINNKSILPLKSQDKIKLEENKREKWKVKEYETQYLWFTQPTLSITSRNEKVKPSLHHINTKGLHFFFFFLF